MKFDEFEARLNDLLDRRLEWDADPEVAQLIKDSAEHRSLAAAYAAAVSPRTLNKLDPLPPCAPPAALADRILAALAPVAHLPQAADSAAVQTTAAPHDQGARTTFNGWWAACLALAAALLVAVGMLVFRAQQSPDGLPLANSDQSAPATDSPTGGSHEVAVSPNHTVEHPQTIDPASTASTGESGGPATNDAPVPAAGDATIGALAHEARDKYADLARNTQQAMSEVAMLLPGFGPPPKAKQKPGADAEAANEANEPSGDWAGHVGDGLEPLTRSAVGALDFILQALPVEQTAPRS